MDLEQIKQGQKDWVKVLNGNEKLLDDNRLVILQDWTTDGVVLENGFYNAGSGMDRAVQWRKIGYADGKTLFTEVFGIVSSDNFKGQKVEFAQLPNAPIPARMYPLGGVLHAASNGNPMGYGWVDVTANGNCTALSMTGRNPENASNPIGGWLGFHIMY